MNDEEIRVDRQGRVAECKTEVEVLLNKYQLGLIAEDFLTPHTKITLDVQFVDMKKYPNAVIAQPDTTTVPETPSVEVTPDTETPSVPEQPTDTETTPA